MKSYIFKHQDCKDPLIMCQLRTSYNFVQKPKQLYPYLNNVIDVIERTSPEVHIGQSYSTNHIKTGHNQVSGH